MIVIRVVVVMVYQHKIIVYLNEGDNMAHYVIGDSMYGSHSVSLFSHVSLFG